MPRNLPKPSQPELSSFNWEDAFLLDNQLLVEERMMRESARAYAQEKLQPRIIQAYADESTDVAAAIHINDAQTRVASYSQWENCESLLAVLHSDEMRKTNSKLSNLSKSFIPVMYDVAEVF